MYLKSVQKKHVGCSAEHFCFIYCISTNTPTYIRCLNADNSPTNSYNNSDNTIRSRDNMQFQVCANSKLLMFLSVYSCRCLHLEHVLALAAVDTSYFQQLQFHVVNIV